MSTHAPNEARVIPLRPQATPPGRGESSHGESNHREPNRGESGRAARPEHTPQRPTPKEPLWRDLVGDALRRERIAQERTLKDVAEAARISMPYLSELERGRKEASSEVLAAAAKALGLGLGGLLSLAQDELVRHTRSRVGHGRVSHARVNQGRTAPTAQYDGLCMAA
ncbi:helix-turn-helix domain-containing protein [Kitasatospora sp. NPDC098652]|uniref:helix-turn-helix domain-containing protein n=1 Tax=Kitasatospora sp. NPDC098652 TaxID=3364095 RepID=UPI0037F2530E